MPRSGKDKFGPATRQSEATPPRKGKAREVGLFGLWLGESTSQKGRAGAGLRGAVDHNQGGMDGHGS
jgi:hypothetical protein